MFKIGDRVICMKSAINTDYCQKDRETTVLEVINCPNCRDECILTDHSPKSQAWHGFPFQQFILSCSKCGMFSSLGTTINKLIFDKNKPNAFEQADRFMTKEIDKVDISLIYEDLRSILSA